MRQVNLAFGENHLPYFGVRRKWSRAPARTHPRGKAGTIRDDYLELIGAIPLRPIRSEREYKAAVQQPDQAFGETPASLGHRRTSGLDATTRFRPVLLAW